ncbi:biotin--[acetyl-CoA-carboxylase] ligase [Treponema phagedenis]|uniref:biotin--[acetyl-CoA-carboxylase] ligase n=1 Tax=Treponema phagedenis TaxID=162 RepID=UPI0001F63D3C|nr:biotin--[acetyl-CoA-carboxylase] ligase [Treponema phagedenis]EFW37385.1 biotin--[acetyl-CoA-carboxylase] ligase [Treponema phagedenis F0421]TYT78355.1 biotin--[acetyl-CoA-carboxylase] ligase [Treponema phagedenis]
MITMNLLNAFSAPVYYKEETSSTMNDARELAKSNCPDGTLVFTGMQNSGRGRLAGRVWHGEKNKNLLCTLILRRAIPQAFTLKIGLAVALALDKFLPADKKTTIKWPNDILIDGKKTCGILCEATDTVLFAGIGCNLLQTEFPQHLRSATSLASVIGTEACPAPQDFVPIFLSSAKACLTDNAAMQKIEEKLWKKNCPVYFIEGTNPANKIQGILKGFSPEGALQIQIGTKIKNFWSGELIL